MKRVLIVGAGFLQRFVIRRAKELGYYTLAVDGNPEAVGFADADAYGVVNIVDQEAVCAFAREHQVDGVLTAATDYGVLAASYTARELGLKGIDYAAAQRVKNKYQVRKYLYEAKADDTGLAYEISGETDLEAVSRQITYPVMVKPCDGSGSRGANRVDGPETFGEACRVAIASSLTGRATAEPFIDGREYGVESFVVDGQVHVLGVLYKWMTQPPYYAELGHALPSGLPEELEKKVRGCVETAIRALGIDFGSVNMDLLLTKEGSVHIVDVGARMGGNLIGSHIIPAGTGIDYMGNMIRAAVGDPVDFRPKAQTTAVATRLLAFPGGTVKQLPDFDHWSVTHNVEICHHLEVGQQVNEYHTNLDGCGYVVSKAATTEIAAEKAEDLRKQIETYIF